MRRGALVALLALGCGGTETVAPLEVDPACAGVAYAELVVLDVWGRSLPDATITGEAMVRIEPGGEASWQADAEGLIPSSITATWDGTLEPGGLTAEADGGALTAVSFDLGAAEERRCHVYSVYVGLDHPWYARTGRAPRGGNDVTLLLDGEDFWAAVYQDLLATGPDARVHQSTWWWQSDFELYRPEGEHHLMTPEERRELTMLDILEERTADVRLLVARFAADTAAGLAYLNTDPALRAHGTDPDDGFELMLQANPTPSPVTGTFEPTPVPVDFPARVRANPAYAERTFAGAESVLQAPLEAFEGASYHQKCVTIGDAIAYVSGQNVKSTDWDTSDHLIFEPRRMVFSATAEERLAVLQRKALPDKGPRKDYGVRIEGPAARDVDDVLRVRWDLGISEGAMYEGDATPYDLLPAAEAAGGTTVQVVATMPDPIAERSILETHIKAINQAEELIFIEDQYFRAPILDELIQARMEAVPGLHLIVITKPVAVADGGKKWTVIADEAYRTRFPDRYLLLWLQAFDREAGEIYLQHVDTHSKIMTVDDVYLNTGSANKNNRGLLYEGELNVAVHSETWVTAARRRVFDNLLGPETAPALEGASGAEIFALFESVSEHNAAFEAAVRADPAAEGAPKGFIYPLVMTPDYLLDVGPDLF